MTQVSAKNEEDDAKKAILLACCDDTIADCNDETFSALELKHPHAHPDTVIPSISEIAHHFYPFVRIHCC